MHIRESSKSDIGLRLTGIFLLAILLCFFVGCGSPEDGFSDPRDPQTDQPDDQNKDPGSDPENPDAIKTPLPITTPRPSTMTRDIASITESENYSVETTVPSLALSFGLLESSGGSYELEPAL